MQHFPRMKDYKQHSYFICITKTLLTNKIRDLQLVENLEGFFAKKNLWEYSNLVITKSV